jgi:SAM-dependent methyltransferase
MTRTNHSTNTPASAATRTATPPAYGCRAAPGYHPQVLATLPPETVARSTGCGDPVGRSDLLVGDVVINLGSGSGIDLILAARTVGPYGHVLGIDRSPELVAAARATISAAGVLDTEVREGRMEALPAPAESADWVFANCAINAALDKWQVFAEIARVLKPGGQTRIADVFTVGLPSWRDRDTAVAESCLARATDEAEYTVGLTEAGLVDVAVGGRYVYDQSQLAAMVPARPEHGAGEFTATDVAEAAVGGVWRAYLYARKPDPRPRRWGLVQSVSGETRAPWSSRKEHQT